MDGRFDVTKTCAEQPCPLSSNRFLHVDCQDYHDSMCVCQYLLCQQILVLHSHDRISYSEAAAAGLRLLVAVATPELRGGGKGTSCSNV